MTRRTITFALLLSMLVIAIGYERAFADPPPWAPAHGWRRHHDHDDGDDDWWKDHQRDEWRHHRRRHDRDDTDARCGEIMDRMRFNNSKIREIEPSGRHRKALQWYRDDNVNARKDLDRCRHGG
jgi:hypothetical protein